MAGGMAMSGRRLQPLEKLRAIRDRYRRKFDTKWQNVTNTNIGASPSLSTTTIPITFQREMEGKQLLFFKVTLFLDRTKTNARFISSRVSKNQLLNWCLWVVI